MPRNVAIRLNYIEWNDALKDEKPYQLVSEDLPGLYGIPRQNFEFGSGPEERISDIRNAQSIFNVDDHGFAILHHSFPEINFGDVASVEQVYQPEVERLLKEKIEGVDELYFFNWRLRANRRSAKTDRLGNIGNAVELLVPAHFVHLDQTLKTAIDYVREYYPDKAEQLLKGRVRIFNIWKPFEVPEVLDCPLALCDGSTLRQQDLLVCDNVTKARVGELILPLYNENAKWYYLSRQTPEDVTVIKIVDSDKQVKAACCPHTAFDLQDVDPDSAPRRSIEMRALIFTYPREL